MNYIHYLYAHYLYTVGGIIVVGTVWHVIHLMLGMHRRSEQFSCSFWNIRVSHMWQIRGRTFLTETLVRDLTIGKEWVLKEKHVREFSWWAIWWRRLFYRWQFVSGPGGYRDHFESSNRVTLFMFRMTHYEEAKMRAASRLSRDLVRPTISPPKKLKSEP